VAATDRFCARCGQANGHHEPEDAAADPNAWQFEQTQTVPVYPFQPEASTPASSPVEAKPLPQAGRTKGPVTAAVLVVLLLGAASVVGWKLLAHNGKAPSAVNQLATGTPASKAVIATAKTTSARPTATPSTATDFAALYARASSGVVRIETVGCSQSGVGTGFLLSPTLVATVNHVVADSAVVSLIVGNQRTTGTVIGTDQSADIALVRADRPLAGYHFQLATTPPAIGSRVAAIGFPIADPITLTVGDVSGLDRNITVEGNSLTGLIETDTPINPGNSGGPLLTLDGAVAGLVDAKRLDAAGIAYAIPATSAASRYSQWTAHPLPLPPASCSNPLGPPQEANPNLAAPSLGSISNAQAAGIAAAFNTYFEGINTGNYAAAWAVLSLRLQGQTPFQNFRTGTSTSYDSNLAVLTAHLTAPDAALVTLSFTSLQSAANGPNGEICDNWTLDYTLVQAGDGSWLIDVTAAHNGTTHTSC
jgi:S1-C subfamily serine protease